MSKNDETIAERIAKLDEMVAWFDSDDFAPERAVEVFRDAEKLATQITDDLDNIKNEVNIIKNKFDKE